MDTNILKINFSKLKKLEVQNLAESVITIVEKHNPEDLQIKEIFDKLVELQPRIDLLTIGYGAHRLTKEINKLRRRRNAFTQGLINKMKTIEDGGIEGMENHIAIAKPKAILYLQGLSKESEKTKVQTISQFLNLIDNNEELANAILALDLIPDLNNLKLVTTDIRALYNKRRESTSARPKAKTLMHVAAIKIAISNLFKQIEVAQIKNADLDYMPLIDELNLEITRAKAEVKARASYNQKKAEGANNNNEVAITSLSEKPSETTEAAPEVNLMSVELENEEDFEELDIKKTAAVSTKQTRLPIVSPEA